MKILMRTLTVLLILLSVPTSLFAQPGFPNAPVVPIPMFTLLALGLTGVSLFVINRKNAEK
jgi:hypothetical protein